MSKTSVCKNCKKPIYSNDYTREYINLGVHWFHVHNKSRYCEQPKLAEPAEVYDVKKVKISPKEIECG